MMPCPRLPCGPLLHNLIFAAIASIEQGESMATRKKFPYSPSFSLDTMEQKIGWRCVHGTGKLR